MSATAAPYGLRPVKRIDGQPYAGAVGEYRIESGETDTFFNGQPVQIASGYVVEISAGDMGTSTTPDEYIGVFMGCSYTDPTSSNKVWRNYYPGSVTASDIVAYVADDPALVFQVQAEDASFDVNAVIGSCYALGETDSGSTLTGNSTIDLDNSAGAGATKPFKVVGLANQPGNTNASGYVDVLVMINGGFHVWQRNG